MRYWFSFVFPWLLALWFLQMLVFRLVFRRKKDLALSPPRPRLVSLGLALAALIIILLPAGGIPLGRWIAGLNLLPGIPLLCLLFGSVWRKSFGNDLFRPNDTLAGWVFGALAGTLLYPFSMGLGAFDPYAWGWGFSALFPVVALSTLYLIWKQSSFGLVLLLSIVAYDLRCLESSNFWDYLIDPVYWLFSLIVLVRHAFKSFAIRKPRPSLERTCPSMNLK